MLRIKKILSHFCTNAKIADSILIYKDKQKFYYTSIIFTIIIKRRLLCCKAEPYCTTVFFATVIMYLSAH